MEFKSDKIEKYAAILLTAAVFFMTLWRFGENLSIALITLMVLVYRPWRQKAFSWQRMKTPVVLLGLLLFLWAMISVSYSQTPNLVRAIQGLLLDYNKLLFLLVLPIALQCIPQYRRRIENGLIYGVLINVIISTLYYYHIPVVVHYLTPYMSEATFFINPLRVIYIVVMSIWLLTMRFVRREGRKTDLLTLVLLTVYLWFINIERSGYLLFLALFFLFLAQQFGKKAVLLGCVLVPVILSVFYVVSPNVKSRIDLGINNLVAYQKMDDPGNIRANNSLGLRLAFISESFNFIKQHPILGTGVGSFRYLYAKLYPEQQESFPATQPHNAYINALLELGCIGFILYLAWLFSIWQLSKKLLQKDGHLLRGILLIFVIMGFADSVLENAIGMSFIFWVSMYLHQEKTSCSLP